MKRTEGNIINSRILLAIGIVAIVLSLLVFKYFYFFGPYLWISCIAFIVTLIYALLSEKKIVRLVWVNICCIAFMVSLGEAYLWSNAKVKLDYKFIKGKQYFVPHDILGYSPAKNCKVSCSKYYSNKLVYDVTYTINFQGLRLGTAYNIKPKRNGVLFFGGSFTFGEGINDNKTFPYLIGKKFKETHITYNFGFHGYGPQQMLAILENNFEETIIKDSLPKFAIYLALIDSHIRRAAGLTAGDNYGTRYNLDKNNKLNYIGQYGGDNLLIKEALQQLKKSFIFKKIYYSFQPGINDGAVDLFLAIIDKARMVFESRYPGAEFFVILWGDSEIYKIEERIKKLNIFVCSIDDILPDFKKNRERYQIHKFDGHPNQLAHKIVADYIADNILGKPAKQTSRSPA